MPWKLDSDRPIYIQLIERIQQDIASGVYQAGDKLPSVRELASEAAVNPNTMQKSLSELERLGFVYAYRTSGRFITEDKQILNKMKKDLAKSHIKEFFERMELLGFNKSNALELIKSTLTEEK